MMQRVSRSSLPVGCLASAATVARPVSYTGGWTVVEESDRQSSSALVHYSPVSNYVTGAQDGDQSGCRLRHFSVHPTVLAKRWFGADYQGNLYFHGGVGLASGINQQPGIEIIWRFYGGVMADWETRTLFVGYRNRYLDAGELCQPIHRRRSEPALLPIEGDSGDLHTWLMLEIDHRPLTQTQ